MIKKYLIDGNNLIGKMPELFSLQKKDKQLSRVKLVRILEEYFANKKFDISLHFDGHPQEAIPTSKIKISYSKNTTADLRIRKEIDNSHSTKTIVVVSSDHEVQNYAKVNSCKIIPSEVFSRELKQKRNDDTEEMIQKSITNEEIKKLFES